MYRNWDGINTEGKQYDKSNSGQKYFLLWPKFKPNVDIIGITGYMWKWHGFTTIFTYNNVINIKYAIGKGFRYKERS